MPKAFTLQQSFQQRTLERCEAPVARRLWFVCFTHNSNLRKQLSNLIGMGFDGAATFSGKKSGVQARMKKQSSHALFVHCHCHQLQLACVQAANGTAGIKHVCDTNHIVEILLLFTQTCTITEKSPESSRLPRIEDC